MEKIESGNYLDLFDLKNFKDKTKRQYLRDYDVPRLYSLFKGVLKLDPNGVYTFAQFGSLPMDNMFWWDFIIACDIGVIHIWRSISFVEIMYRVDLPDFDLDKFLNENLSNYSKEIDEAIESYDKHILYINHYESYSRCVEYLWDEVQKIDLKEPNIPDMMTIGDDFKVEEIAEDIQRFVKNAVKFHALSKSLILNSAFMVDSFVNLLYRIGAKPDVKDNPKILIKALNAEFKERITNINFYTLIFTDKIDIGTSEFRNVIELMTLRNKYVHGDETSQLNKVGETYFDRDFPLFQVDNRQEVVRNISNTYLIPDFELTKKSYESAIGFIKYIRNYIKPEIEKQVSYLMSFNPIGYNTKLKAYSAIAPINHMPLMQAKGRTDEIKKMVK